MILAVKRIHDNGNTTIGGLYINGNFECFTLEDEHRQKKVYAETRIPEGKYLINFRTVGGFNKRYSGKFPEFHKGMLQVMDVPNFEYILIHIGNTDKDTAGCLLVGKDLGWINGRRAVTHSTAAYMEFYPKVSNALDCGEVVTIEYIDLEI